MGFEIRKVEPGYVPPVDDHGKPKRAYYEGYETALAEWFEGREHWPESEERKKYQCTWEEYAGRAPDPETYMWYGKTPPIEARTHFMLYSNISEGCPETPAFATVEELAMWLSKNGLARWDWKPDTYESYLAAMMTHFDKNGEIIRDR